MKGFDEEYQAKSYHIYHRVVVSLYRRRGEVGSTHTHISNQTLYYIFKIHIYFSNFNDSATSLQQSQSQ